MSDKTIRQFHSMSLVGGACSLVGCGGLLAVGLTTLTLAVATILTQLFVLLSLFGLIVSTIGLVLARKALLPFWDNSRAYLSGCIGVALPAALVILYFARIVQRLLLQAA